MNMPSFSYKVNDPVSPVSYKPRSEYTYTADSGQHSFTDSGHHSYSNGSSRNGTMQEQEKWRQNYVPSNYDYSISKSTSTFQPRPPVHPAERDLELSTSPIDDEPNERGQWSNKCEFVLSCIGWSVGIGNVWRFPYLAYENGGGSFLIPYIILLILVGKPMYYMEAALGQYTQLGPMSVWKMAPICKGVGFAMVTVSLIVSIYYNVIMSYCLYYMFASFRLELPWTRCSEWWGADDNCYERTSNVTRCYGNSSDVEGCVTANQTATEQFWERYVLGITDYKDGMGEPGDIGVIKWDLALCLLLAWIVVFLCLMKGIKTSGKVVYVTATVPYAILIALLVRGVTLEGSEKGISHFFVPDFDKLMDIQVWRKAAEQMFFSLGLTWGGLIMYGSYNKFRNKVHIDASVISSLDFLTSVIAGVAIFSVLGHMAHEVGVDVEHVVKGGQGLAFIAYPEALVKLPLPMVWSILFFFMLFILGLDSQFALLETALTAMYDEFPRTRKYKILVTAIACACCFLVGIPMVSQSGNYIVNLMDYYGGGVSVVLIAIFEVISVMWVYGVRRFSDDLAFMLGSQPFLFWKVCWAFFAPFLLIGIFAISVVFWKEATYNDIPYPEWAQYVGWFLALVSVGQIPLIGLIVLFFYTVKMKPLKAFKPQADWGPGDTGAREQLLQSKFTFTKPTLDTYAYDNPAMRYTHKY